MSDFTSLLWPDIDFQARIKSRITNQLSQGGLPEIFAALGSNHQDIDEFTRYLYATQNILLASGIELDRFGEYVDVKRYGRDDFEYRLAILLAKYSKGYSGTPPEVMLAAAVLTQSLDVEMVEHRPAQASIHVTGLSVPLNINATLGSCAVAGVAIHTTHDYGTDGFTLSGVDKGGAFVLGVESDTTALAVDTNTALELRAGFSVWLGGDYLDSTLNYGMPPLCGAMPGRG